MNQEIKRKKRRKKKVSLLIPILCIVVGILIGILGSMLFMGKGAGKNNAGGQQSTSTNTVEEMLKEDSFKIETEYCDLYYPLKWKEQVRVEVVEGDVYTVQFYAALEEKEEMHLFDIAFAGEEGIELGYLESENGEEIAVDYISYEPEFGEGWSEEEQNDIYAMAEDVNYIIGMLQKEAGFVSAY